MKKETRGVGDAATRGERKTCAKTPPAVHRVAASPRLRVNLFHPSSLLYNLAAVVGIRYYENGQFVRWTPSAWNDKRAAL